MSFKPQDAFSVFDKQGKGLSIDEMRKILSSYGEKLPPEEIDEFLALMEVALLLKIFVP